MTQGDAYAVGGVLDALVAISARASKDASLPASHSADALALLQSADGLSSLERQPGAIVGAAHLAIGPPLTRLVRISRLNEAYMSSSVSSRQYHDLGLGLLELLAASLPLQPQSTPTPTHRS